MSKEQIYIEFIIEELDKRNVKYNDVCVLFCTKFDLTKQTFNKFWKLANEAYSERLSLINEAKLNETINIEKEAVKINIKTKNERIQNYQKEIDDSISELEYGFTEEMKSTGELIKRPLTISEKCMLRKTIKELQSEISKIESDYAATKVDQTINEIRVIRTDADKIE